MRVVLFDENRQKLAGVDISGTEWQATYHGFFNLTPIALRCVCLGKPAFLEIMDGAEIRTINRMPWSESYPGLLDYVDVDDVVYIARGKFVWTMSEKVFA